MSLRPETRESAAAAAKTLADDYGCTLRHAKEELWEVVCRYVQPGGLKGDVKHDTINPADIDAAYLDLRAEWDTNPPPKAPPPPEAPAPEPSPDLSAPSRCRSDKCRAQIRWGKLNGRTHPFDLDGVTSHYSTCKDAERFRRQKGAA